jgi:hypothetical protein
MTTISSIDSYPGDAEAHAAGVAMAELYGSPAQGEGRWVNGRLVSTYAVGDSVNVAFPDGHRRCVVVEVLTDTTYHVVHHKPGGGREHYAIDVDAIAAF